MAPGHPSGAGDPRETAITSRAATGPGPASTRERILEAAAEVFAERGYEGAAVSDIARRAGFTTGAIYGCFRDKGELLLEVIRAALRTQQEAAISASRAARQPELAGRFAALAGAFLDDEAGAQRALVLEAHVAARRDEDIGAVLRAYQSGRLDALTSLVREAQAHGTVADALDPATVAMLFMAIPLGLVLLDAAGVALPETARWQAVAEHMTATLRPPG